MDEAERLEMSEKTSDVDTPQEAEAATLEITQPDAEPIPEESVAAEDGLAEDALQSEDAAEGAAHPVPERLRRRGGQQTRVDADCAGDAVAGRLVGERDVGDDAGMGQERRKAQAAEFLDRKKQGKELPI